MKNKKNLLLMFALFVMAALVVVGCSSTTPTATKDPATAPAPAKAESVKAVSLTDQVKNSGHAKIFPTMVGKGPDVKKDDTEHYGDGCIRCHSAVKMLDDKDAKLDDFFTGGKYAGKTEGISCRVCHTFEGKELMSLRNKGWESCGSCHVNSSGDPKPGTEVHHPQFQMIKGVAIGDFPAKPSFFTLRDLESASWENPKPATPIMTTNISTPSMIAFPSCCFPLVTQDFHLSL
ncbi:MAG: hypothetical protein M0T74_14980 [Desulfitobacterium hafniense]|nr:hypothetical protein [Desulfitobacterium hafniense]